MTTHQMGLQEKYFEFMKNGTKRIELRLFDEKRRAIRLGDTIEFKNQKTKEILKAKVVGLLRYPTFQEMFKDFPAEIFADKSISKDEMLKIMEEFYPLEKQQRLGVIGIRIRPF